MERITFDMLPEMVALILEKLERIESIIGTGRRGVDPDMDKEMLTTEEAAKFMGVSKSTLYKMSFNRDIPVYKPTGKRIYFKKEDMLNHMQQNRAMSSKEIEQEAANYIFNRSTKRRALRM